MLALNRERADFEGYEFRGNWNPKIFRGPAIIPASQKAEAG
jgi:hypothetical protein